MLKMEAFDICDKLLSQRGHFYVCGDVSMAEDVCRTLQVIPLCLTIVKFSYTTRVVEAPANMTAPTSTEGRFFSMKISGPSESVVYQ